MFPPQLEFSGCSCLWTSLLGFLHKLHLFFSYFVTTMFQGAPAAAVLACLLMCLLATVTVEILVPRLGSASDEHEHHPISSSGQSVKQRSILSRKILEVHQEDVDANAVQRRSVGDILPPIAFGKKTIPAARYRKRAQFLEKKQATSAHLPRNGATIAGQTPMSKNNSTAVSGEHRKSDGDNDSLFHVDYSSPGTHPPHSH